MTSDSRIQLLLQKGVQIPNPASIQIGDDLDIKSISGNQVVLYGGCKLFGRHTVIGPCTSIGYEGPVTLENCQTGPNVKLGAGFFKDSVFMANVRIGSGAHVREGCLLEEHASCAHTVGIKQTILFPYVTLGSLINFCDCLMAGGTSARNHSEVGSSYIHFNYTPNQDKATPSLLGDVPRGVMLRQPPVFLGGQGGLVGPTRLTFGTVTAAGTICRQDELRPGRLIFGGASRRGNVPFSPGVQLNLKRIVQNNIIYMANLLALRQWYLHARRQFIGPDYSKALHQGALNVLDAAIAERSQRFISFCKGAALEAGEMSSTGTSGEDVSGTIRRQALATRGSQIGDAITGCRNLKGDQKTAEFFLNGIARGIRAWGPDYLRVIHQLDAATVDAGSTWLQDITDAIMREVFLIIPEFT